MQVKFGPGEIRQLKDTLKRVDRQGKTSPRKSNPSSREKVENERENDYRGNQKQREMSHTYPANIRLFFRRKMEQG